MTLQLRRARHQHMATAAPCLRRHRHLRHLHRRRLASKSLASAFVRPPEAGHVMRSRVVVPGRPDRTCAQLRGSRRPARGGWAGILRMTHPVRRFPLPLCHPAIAGRGANSPRCRPSCSCAIRHHNTRVPRRQSHAHARPKDNHPDTDTRTGTARNAQSWRWHAHTHGPQSHQAAWLGLGWGWA